MNTIVKRSGKLSLLKYSAGIAVTLLGLSAMAESLDPDSFNLIVIQDRAFGRAIESGRHEQAITSLEKKGYRDSKRFSVNTNLCVAYLMAKNPDAATVHCDVAVASQSKKTHPGVTWHYGDEDKDRAIALSNRGVLRALTGDYKGARRDLEAAVSLNSGLSHPVINLAKLETKKIGSSASLR